MSENVIQAFGIVVLFVLSRVLAKEATVPDTKGFNCSFDVQVDHFPSRINLCFLEGVVNLNVYPDETSSGGNSPSINIHRYYLINAFGRIQGRANKHNVSKVTDTPVLSGTNCPSYSTSCLVSEVTFSECNNNNEDNDGVCYNNKHTTADSYGWRERWKKKVVYPPEPDGWTASITMQGGPCYYCDDTNLKLRTVIRFYCDERRTGTGKLIRKHDPTKREPEVLLHWNTSAACYQFIPNEKCDFSDFLTKTCNKSFGCKSMYRWPPSANNPINTRDSSITYTFGFCARNVQCPTDENDVMICRKKDGEEPKALAYYSDAIGFIARPTGFVMRIIDKQPREDGHLKAVISFECLPASTEVLSMTVLDIIDLPILLTIKHRCFCPGHDSDSCQAVPYPTLSPIIDPTTKPRSDAGFLIGLISAIVVLCVIVVILLYIRHNCSTRTRIEVPPSPNNDGDGGAGGGHEEENEGAVSTDSPASTYYSCHSSIPSNDSLLSDLSNVSGPNERTPLLTGQKDVSETQESGV